MDITSIIIDPASFLNEAANHISDGPFPSEGDSLFDVTPTTEDFSTLFAQCGAVFGVVVGKLDDGAPAVRALECKL